MYWTEILIIVLLLIIFLIMVIACSCRNDYTNIDKESEKFFVIRAN